MRYGAVTDVGKIRKINEDNYHVETNADFPYVIVADGMGGHKAGEVASMMAVDIISNHLANNLSTELDYVEAAEVVRKAFISANNIIYNYSIQNFEQAVMGTTASLAMIYDGKLITAHVGDSRVYAISEHSICQVTRDHSYVQELVYLGRLTPYEAKHNSKKNFIMRAMGAEETVKVDIGILPYKNEKIFLCSDGLSNLVEDDEIFNYVKYSKDFDTAMQELVNLANLRGGTDNITAAVFEG